MKELLSLAKYTISDVQETGGVFIVQVNWNCDFDKSAPCNPDPVRVFRYEKKKKEDYVSDWIVLNSESINLKNLQRPQDSIFATLTTIISQMKLEV